MASIAPSITETRSPPLHDRRADWLVLGGFALLALFVRGAGFGDPIAGAEEQLNSYIGLRLLSGELPFADWQTLEPFGLFAIFALAHWHFGPEAMAYQAFAAVATFVGSILVSTLTRTVADRRAAAIAGALFMLMTSAYGDYASASETFLVPVMLAALLLVSRNTTGPTSARILTGMLLCGLGLQIDYAALPFCVLLLIWILRQEVLLGATPERLARLLCTYLAPMAAPMALVALIYMIGGNQDAFWLATREAFSANAAALGAHLDTDRLAMLLSLAGRSGCGLYGAIPTASSRTMSPQLLHALWFVAAIISALWQGDASPACYAMLVPGALLLAAPLFSSSSGSVLVITLSLLVSGAQILMLPAQYQEASSRNGEIGRFAAAISPLVDDRTRCLYVFDGPAALYRLSGGCVPTRLVDPRVLSDMTDKTDAIQTQERELSRILSSRPAVIVTTSTPTHRKNLAGLLQVGEAIRANYSPLASVQVGDLRYHAWHRR